MRNRKKRGRPRGGEHHEEVREYWRQAKGYKERQDDLDDWIKRLLSWKREG